MRRRKSGGAGSRKTQLMIVGGSFNSGGIPYFTGKLVRFHSARHLLSASFAPRTHKPPRIGVALAIRDIFAYP